MTISDKRTIGLTEKNRKVMDQLVDEFYFKERIHAAKFAMAFAIKENVEISSINTTDTSWNVGSFDADGEIKTLIMSLYPHIETPYRAVETLVNIGLTMIGQKLESEEEFNIVDMIEDSK